MAIDFLSAPGTKSYESIFHANLNEWKLASSVDAERAFSGGRLQVNHLQHNVSSQTFKARVALGSWVNTPLLPDDLPVEIMGNIMKPPAKKGQPKGKGKVDQVELSDSDASN